MSCVILRTAWVFSGRRSNFVLTMLKLARERPELRVVNDQFGSPTWARALAEDTAALLGKGDQLREQGGVYHLTAAGEVSRYDFAVAIIDRMRMLTGQATGWARLIPVSTAEYPLPAKRPYYSVISMDKIRKAFGIEPEDWSRHLADCLAEMTAR